MLPGPGNQVLHGPRHEHLTGVGLAHSTASREMDRDPCRFSADERALAGVQSSTNHQAAWLGAADDRLGARDRPGRSVEAAEESVAGGVDLRSAEPSAVRGAHRHGAVASNSRQASSPMLAAMTVESVRSVNRKVASTVS